MNEGPIFQRRATVCVPGCWKGKPSPRLWVFWGRWRSVPEDYITKHTLARAHTHTWWQGYCLPPTLSPPIYWIHINAARRGVCVCVIIIASDFFFFQRMQNNGRGGGVNVRRWPWGWLWCLECRMNAVIDKLTTWTHTLWMHRAAAAQLHSTASSHFHPAFFHSLQHKQIRVPACWHQSHTAWLVLGCSPAYWKAWHLWRQTAW